MINIKNQVPNIYYDASRDFQILGHLYEVALNYVKTNVDMLYLLPNGIEEDTRATELLATTLGFKLRRNYDKKQLAALVSIFPQLLKVKGTLAAINLAGNALVKASGVPGEFSIDPKELEKTHVLTIKIPIELSDITLFLDLLPYILPFGIRVSIIRATAITEKQSSRIGTTAAMRKALPGYDRFAPHALGLAKISDNNGSFAVEYSSSNFINSEVEEVIDGVSKTNKAIAGQLGASPIIAFDVRDEEENT
jgi:hypothetical protein